MSDRERRDPPGVRADRHAGGGPIGDHPTGNDPTGGDPTSNDPTTDDIDALFQVLGGKVRVQALSTFCALGLADRLAAAPATAAELAAANGGDVELLASVLRLTAGLGFLDSQPPGVYSLTRRGELLRGDRLGPLVAFLGAPEQWDPWSRLRDALSAPPGDETVPFRRVYGVDLYAFLARDGEAARRYDAAIDAFTRQQAQALGDACDFGGVHTVVDVGGGRGTLLLELLRRWPHLHGVLHDLPHVIGAVGDRLAQALPGRVRTVAGDFLDGVPAGGDRYVIKHVLHNWDDERARRLLSHCAAALRPDGRVLVIETILSPDDRPDLAAMLDLEMRVLTGGRGRRKPEWRQLFRAAGLTLEHTSSLAGASFLLIGAPLPD